MSKFIIGGIVFLAIGAIVLGGNNILHTEKGNNIKSEDVVNIPDGSLISFQLYKSYEVDTSGFRKKFKVAEGTPFTFFLQVYNLDTWKNIGEFRETNFDFPDFDFNSDDYQDKYLVVSFGREVLEIEKIKMAYQYLENVKSTTIEAAITFAEEYHDQTMFLYIMDKIHLLEGLGSEFYIMNGSEKVFLGKSVLEINESAPSDLQSE